MILGSRFLFTTALADKAHYIICLEEKFSAAACVAQGGLLEKIRQIFFFRLVLFHSFRAIFLQIAGKLHVKKASKVERKRAARSSFKHSFFFFAFFHFPSKKPGGGQPPLRAVCGAGVWGQRGAPSCPIAAGKSSWLSTGVSRGIPPALKRG